MEHRRLTSKSDLERNGGQSGGHGRLTSKSLTTMSLDTVTTVKMKEDIPSLPPKKRLSSRICHDDAPDSSPSATLSESVSKKRRLTEEDLRRLIETKTMKQYDNYLTTQRPIHASAVYDPHLRVSAMITMTRRLGFFFVNVTLNGVPSARIHLEYRPNPMKRMRENFILIDVFQTAGSKTLILKEECDLTSAKKASHLTLRCNNEKTKFEFFIDMENVIGYIRESKRLLMETLLLVFQKYSRLEAPSDGETASFQKTLRMMERLSMTQF